MSHREYPIAFTRPDHVNVAGAFQRVGLFSHAEQAHPLGHQMRSMLVTKRLLFAMQPPALRPLKPHRFFVHTEYTGAALQDAPAIHDMNRSAWRSALTEHLVDFAAQPTAIKMIARGLVSHYNNFADLAVRLPHSNEQTWIPGYRAGEVDALGHLGVPSTRSTPLSYEDEYKDPKDQQRTYLPIEKLVSHIGWVIPGIHQAQTRAAISEEFAATHNPERVADPETLFMLGRIAWMPPSAESLKNFFRH